MKITPEPGYVLVPNWVFRIVQRMDNPDGTIKYHELAPKTTTMKIYKNNKQRSKRLRSTLLDLLDLLDL